MNSPRPRWRFDPSRREVLALPLAVLAAGCSRPYRRGDFAHPERSSLALFAVDRYDRDLTDLVGRGLKALGVSVAGRRVLLKPNLVEYDQHSAINTHPAVVAAAAEAILRAGAASVVVAEGPGHRRDAEYLLVASGLFDTLRDLRLRFVDLNHDEVRPVALKSRFAGVSELLLPRTVLEADLVVSMPKLKTHHLAGMTCGMKNLFGVVPGAVYGWPKNFLHLHGIAESILDLAATVRPGLTIVDAVTAMEGDGPIMGRPRAMGLLAMGTDVVAVDAALARLIGLEPARMRYLAEAGRFLGNADMARHDHVGERPARFASRFAVIDAMRSLQANP
jgi:uncharacterized protein (DUF362 family)